MASQHDLDTLARRISDGIASSGSAIVDGRDLEILWKAQATDEEKRAAVKNFAAHYGFTADIGPHFVIAAFQKAAG
ncbi:MAG TPA: hypothetical protein VG733_10835 [Chthoniobacteraceae bacterium]|nr:hypothetical protein [Chthoniobacteraceae bacterium]